MRGLELATFSLKVNALPLRLLYSTPPKLRGPRCTEVISNRTVKRTVLELAKLRKLQGDLCTRMETRD